MKVSNVNVNESKYENGEKLKSGNGQEIMRVYLLAARWNCQPKSYSQRQRFKCVIK